MLNELLLVSSFLAPAFGDGAAYRLFVTAAYGGAMVRREAVINDFDKKFNDIPLRQYYDRKSNGTALRYYYCSSESFFSHLLLTLQRPPGARSV